VDEVDTAASLEFFYLLTTERMALSRPGTTAFVYSLKYCASTLTVQSTVERISLFLKPYSACLGCSRLLLSLFAIAFLQQRTDGHIADIARAHLLITASLEKKSYSSLRRPLVDILADRDNESELLEWTMLVGLLLTSVFNLGRLLRPAVDAISCSFDSIPEQHLIGPFLKA